MSLLNPSSYTVKVSAIIDVDTGFQEIYTADDHFDNTFRKVFIVGLTSDRDDVIFSYYDPIGLTKAYTKNGVFYIPYGADKPTTLTFKSTLKTDSANWHQTSINLNIGATVTVQTLE